MSKSRSTKKVQPEAYASYFYSGVLRAGFGSLEVGDVHPQILLKNKQELYGNDVKARFVKSKLPLESIINTLNEELEELKLNDKLYKGTITQIVPILKKATGASTCSFIGFKKVNDNAEEEEENEKSENDKEEAVEKNVKKTNTKKNKKLDDEVKKTNTKKVLKTKKVKSKDDEDEEDENEDENDNEDEDEDEEEDVKEVKKTNTKKNLKTKKVTSKEDDDEDDDEEEKEEVKKETKTKNKKILKSKNSSKLDSDEDIKVKRTNKSTIILSDNSDEEDN